MCLCFLKAYLSATERVYQQSHQFAAEMPQNERM